MADFPIPHQCCTPAAQAPPLIKEMLHQLLPRTVIPEKDIQSLHVRSFISELSGVMSLVLNCITIQGKMTAQACFMSKVIFNRALKGKGEKS